ncbi:hypothetical protein AUJ68_01295 [Candidatus Woesearchaeota archaeon CG1_02_57_44]|nr:MAG: hypothetical protein AUJ68_01295 [Candidatus Woesearchaeota archaeon CG1_02_57_44]
MSKATSKATRDGFGKALVALGAENKDIVVLDADLCNSTRSEWFEQAYPERFLNVGIAEQNMVGIAAGMALSGKTAFACSFAGFLVNRAHDHIRISVCYNNADVKLVGTHAGIQIGEDGPTNQSITDIASMRSLPHMVVVQPCDVVEAAKAVKAVAAHKGPCYLRLTRNSVETTTDDATPFELGKGVVLRKAKAGADGTIVTFMASGATVPEALHAAEQLGEHVGVVNIHTIKPIDEALIKLCASHGPIVTIEDHSIYGGLGSAVAEVAASIGGIVHRIGITGFAQSGTGAELYDAYGLSAQRIAEQARKLIKKQ